MNLKWVTFFHLSLFSGRKLCILSHWSTFIPHYKIQMDSSCSCMWAALTLKWFLACYSNSNLCIECFFFIIWRQFLCADGTTDLVTLVMEFKQSVFMSLCVHGCVHTQGWNGLELSGYYNTDSPLNSLLIFIFHSGLLLHGNPSCYCGNDDFSVVVGCLLFSKPKAVFFLFAYIIVASFFKTKYMFLIILWNRFMLLFFGGNINVYTCIKR